MHHPRFAAIFRRMRRSILVSTAVLLAIFFLVAGCGAGGSQADNQHHATQGRSAKLLLHPEGNSGVRGTATFEDV
jgi:hypothetical protein